MKIESQADADADSEIFFIGFDKLTHLGLFYLLTVLLFYGRLNYSRSYGFNALTLVKIFLISLVLGGGIEILHWKVFTYRSAEWWDLGCDLLGCLMAMSNYVLLHASNYNEEKV